MFDLMTNGTPIALPEFTGEQFTRDNERHWVATFPNGYVLSIAQSARHYCSGDSVEIYCYAPDDKPAWNDVRGWQTVTETIETMWEVSRYGREIGNNNE